jgi:hypothetical protein
VAQADSAECHAACGEDGQASCHPAATPLSHTVGPTPNLPLGLSWTGCDYFVLSKLEGYRMPETNHELADFMRDATLQMASDYDRIQKRAADDPGTAGDQGEENWATLLRRWLPPVYQVVTKGRILSDEGTAGPQVDVLVLSPSYPQALLDKKLYLAGGVLAAFECKVTLKAAYVRDFIEHAASISRLAPRRMGSPFRELNSPLVYGLLAHAHVWNMPNSTPSVNIERSLLDADEEFVKHPSEMPNLLCVANLGAWTKSASAWIGPGMSIWSEKMAEIFGKEGAVTTGYIQHTKDAPDKWAADQPVGFTPIGVAISQLLNRLAADDDSLRRIALYFMRVGLVGRGVGKQRLWPGAVYSPEVRAGIAAGRLVNGKLWDEWDLPP